MICKNVQMKWYDILYCYFILFIFFAFIAHYFILFYFLRLILYETTSTSDIPIPWQCEEVINVLAMMSNLIIPGCSALQTECIKQTKSSNFTRVVCCAWHQAACFLHSVLETQVWITGQKSQCSSATRC